MSVLAPQAAANHFIWNIVRLSLRLLQGKISITAIFVTAQLPERGHGPFLNMALV